MATNEQLIEVTILGTDGGRIRNGYMAGDWRLECVAGKAVLYAPLTVMTYGELMAIVELAYKDTPVSLEIGRHKFQGFAIREVVFSSLLDESIPDHVLTVKAKSLKEPGKEDMDKWLA